MVRRRTFTFTLVLLLLSISASAFAAVTTETGTFPDGATFLIEVPSPWNGTLVLYSHGYVIPGSPNPARDVGDPGTRAFLLANGFALAGSSYAHTGWAIQEALVDQIAVLDHFAASFGPPTRTIAWGHSLGGIITGGLIQRFPSRFDGALPMCGVLAGGVATWNQALDAAFAPDEANIVTAAHKFLRDCDRRIRVPAGPAAREQREDAVAHDALAGARRLALRVDVGLGCGCNP